jgi:hypothetical protein
MNIGLVRERLAEACLTIEGLNCYGYAPDAVTVPCFFAAEVDIAFDRHAFNGKGDEVTATLRLLVSKADDKEGQGALDAYLGRGDRSIKLAIEAARGAPGEAALDGACDDLHVLRVQGYRLYEHNGIDYYGAEFVVRVIGEGDGE